MPESLEFAAELPPNLRAYLAYEVAADALMDPRGVLVRCTPRRRTVMHFLPHGGRVFCKARQGHVQDAVREWRTLRQLRIPGVELPRPLFLARRGAASVLGMAAVPGRPLDAQLAEGQGRQAALRMPAALRAMHDQGWVYRDMYWNHCFADDQPPLYWIDVERAFKPRWRWRRWVIKDLAGLAASTPVDAGITRTDRLRFLRDYLGGLDTTWKALADAVTRKAARIAAHVTRFPG